MGQYLSFKQKIKLAFFGNVDMDATPRYGLEASQYLVLNKIASKNGAGVGLTSIVRTFQLHTTKFHILVIANQIWPHFLTDDFDYHD